MFANNERPILHTDILGEPRHIHDKHSINPEIEILFDVEKLSGERKYGYIKLTDDIKNIFELIGNNKIENRSISFVEWDNGTYNTIFRGGDGIHKKYYAISTIEFEEWIRRLQTCSELTDECM